MLEVYKKIAMVSDSRSTVLIYGESGTGKELVAKAIHHNGPRAHRRARRQLLRPDVAEQAAHLTERRLRLDIAGDHEDCVVRRIPRAVEALQHRGGGLLERGPRAERIVRIRRAGKKSGAQLGVQHIAGLGQILRDFLLDRAALWLHSFAVLSAARMRSASMCSATSRSSAGTVNRYCVSPSRVSALKSPPRTLPMSAS